MYLRHSVEKEGTVIQARFRFQSARPPSRHPCPPHSITHPFPPLVVGLSLHPPPSPWPYLLPEYHKVYWKPGTTGDISINLHICKMCSVHWAFVGECEHAKLSVYSCASVKSRAERSEPSVSKQSICLLARVVLTRLPNVCRVGGWRVILCLRPLNTHELRWKKTPSRPQFISWCNALAVCSVT